MVEISRGGFGMKIKIVKKEKSIDEDLFSNVKPNSQRKKPITSKQRRELEQSDKESRKRSKQRDKREREIYPGHKELMSVLESMVINEIEEAKKKKSRKIPACGSGNPFHKSDGTFGSDKTRGGSWSIRHAEGSDCSHGQTKYDGGKRKFTKLKCGRKDRTNPNVKADYRCKDGSKVNEVQEQDDEFVRIKRSAFERLIMELDVEPDLLDENDDVIKSCNARGLFTIKQFLQHINNLQRATDGELLDAPKQTKKK